MNFDTSYKMIIHASTAFRKEKIRIYVKKIMWDNTKKVFYFHIPNVKITITSMQII